MTIPNNYQGSTASHEFKVQKMLILLFYPFQPPKIPWRDIARTKAVWALALTHFGYNWGFYTLLTQLPSYMSTVLCFDIGKASIVITVVLNIFVGVTTLMSILNGLYFSFQNGILSSLPYVVMMIVGYTSSYLADLVIKRGLVRTVVIRKSFNTVGKNINVTKYITSLLINVGNYFSNVITNIACFFNSIIWISNFTAYHYISQFPNHGHLYNVNIGCGLLWWHLCWISN